jgi:hypothetical protein
MSSLFWPFSVLDSKLDAIIANQDAAKKRELRMAQSLDDVIADITDLGSKEDGLIALTTNIKAQLDAVLAGSLTPAQQAKVDAIFSAVEARKTAVVDAITANTPTTPPSP